MKVEEEEMPMIRRFGRPGLLGLAARTAVVAGTAGAVSGAMNNARQRRAQADYEREQYEIAAHHAQQSINNPDAVSSHTPDDSVIGKIQQLSSLHDSGALTDKEFSAAKARILG